MRRGTRAIGDVIVQIQEVFLDSPGLALMPADVQSRWPLDRTAATELLRVLADAGVLTVDDGGTYRRNFPSTRRPAAADPWNRRRLIAQTAA